MPMQSTKNVQKQIISQPSDNLPSEEISGSVTRILYQDMGTGFTIFQLTTATKSTCVVRGTFAVLFRGQVVHLHGTWGKHPTFGLQFTATSYYSTAPTSHEGLIRYLSSGLIKGIGESFAQKLVDHFGKDILTIIDTAPHRLAAIPGLGKGRVQAIIDSWAEHKERAQVMMLLREKGISLLYATKLYRQYREQTMAILRTNAYQIIDTIWGIGFTTADTIARSMGIATNSPLRITAGIRWNLKKNAQQGHLYVTCTSIIAHTNELLEFTTEDAKLSTTAHIEYLCSTHELIRITAQGNSYIALPSTYQAEQSIAKRLKYISASSARMPVRTEIIDAAKLSFWHHLTDEQRTAVMCTVQQKITVITGGPGTGKTTLIRALIGILESQHISYKLAAPTGRAAKRMAESTRRTATTIHRLLELDPLHGQSPYHTQHPLPAEYIIIDESSMIDIFLAEALIKAINPQSVLVLIGDIDQLPPVGPGNFLRDCIASGIIPTLYLTHIFRQVHDSLITHNAHRIKSGKFPITRAADTLPDFLFITEDNPEQFLTHLKDILYREMPRRGYTATDSIVLCPMNRSHTGTQQVNAFLQRCFNGEAKQPYLLSHGIQFKIGDRVMQLRNAYDKGIFNGDIGIITTVNTDETSCTVLFDGRPVHYTQDELSELTLAYAMTIHKSQGSEFPVVIIPLFMEHYTMLRKNLLYTAITRARALCVIIGQKRALACALHQKTAGTTRITLLTQLLQSADSCVS